MSVPTAERTPAAAGASGTAAPGVPLWRSMSPGRFYALLAAFAVVVATLSLLIPSTPSYDPWAWLVWGREIVHLDLHTTAGPTWKPLPVIFTTVFSLFGGAAPDLWLIVARVGGVMAVVMVFRVAARVAGMLALPREGVGRLAAAGPAVLAGGIAAVGLALSDGFLSDSALGYSEGLLTASVLIALDRHLDGKYRQAFAVGFIAALDRPEIWLFWGPYGLWLWWRDPGSRKLVIAMFALIPVLWFLPEYWGSGHFLRGVNRAQHPRSNSPAFAKCPFCTELSKHAWPAVLLRIKVAAALAAAAAAALLWRTGRASGGLRSLVRGWQAQGPRGRALATIVATGVLGLSWWVLVAILTQAGFSGNDRYLVLGASLIEIAGGVGWGWLALSVARVGGERLPAMRGGARAAALGVLAAAFLLVPNWVGNNLIDVQRTHRALVYQAHLRTDMGRAIRLLGGRSRVLSCGSVMTEGFQVPMLAWHLGVHTASIGASPLSRASAGPAPNVIFQTRAQRNAHLLPLLSDWPGVHYQRVTHTRTFRVYASCAGNVRL